MTVKKLQLIANVEARKGCADCAAAFYALSNDGMAPGSLYYESQDEHGGFTGFSIAVYKPSVYLRGKDNHFEFNALDARGEEILSQLDLTDMEIVPGHHSHQKVSGTLTPDVSQTELGARLGARNHMGLIRRLLADLDIEAKYQHLPIGLFGGFAYEMVRQFEAVGAARKDSVQDDDYCFYLATRLLVVDHLSDKTYLISLAPKNSPKAQITQDFNEMRAALSSTLSLNNASVLVGQFKSDTDQPTYEANTKALIDHVEQGDIFQVQYGRQLTAEFKGNAFKVFMTLKALNPSPYMFYMRDDQGVLLGSSPELNVGVKRLKNGDMRIDIAPIAGTKPRGFVKGQPGKICEELDERYAISLQTDEKEMAEHVMLIDLVRNDIAAIAQTGTTLVKQALAIKKFSHVQHLVSHVSGILKPEIDALTAYLATMNMGTLTGAPKPKAMQLIAEFEENQRGYYGGGFGFITHKGEMETTIVIRSMRIKHNTVYLRASAGIVADSVPKSEWQETENKMKACIKALEVASHD